MVQSAGIEINTQASKQRDAEWRKHLLDEMDRVKIADEARWARESIRENLVLEAMLDFPDMFRKESSNLGLPQAVKFLGEHNLSKLIPFMVHLGSTEDKLPIEALNPFRGNPLSSILISTIAIVKPPIQEGSKEHDYSHQFENWFGEKYTDLLRNVKSCNMYVSIKKALGAKREGLIDLLDDSSSQITDEKRKEYQKELDEIGDRYLIGEDYARFAYFAGRTVFRFLGEDDTKIGVPLTLDEHVAMQKELNKYTL